VRTPGFVAATCVAVLLACGHSSSKNTSGTSDAGLLTVPTPDGGTVGALDGAAPAVGHVDVLTQHNDVSRTGQNLYETTLTTSNVRSATFGKLFTLPVDGIIYAQPLIVTSTPIADAGVHDVVIVATMHNSVYAFDANSGGAPLWQVNLGPSVPNTEVGPFNDAGTQRLGTQNIQVEVGILSTPVIDRDNGLIYLTRKDYTSSVQTLKFHVLSLATGQDMPGSPATITASVEGTGTNSGTTITLDPILHAQRPALLLANGVVYMAFASHEDYRPFHGWILGYQYDAAKKAITKPLVFNVTPDGTEGGIWMSGQGLLSDGTGIYANVANGSVTAPTGGSSYGESFLKLSFDLQPQDYFVPYDFDDLNTDDIDMGAGGPVLIPGTSPPMITGGGKSGVLYLVNTTNMGHLGTVDNMASQWFQATTAIYGAPVVWTGTGAPLLYLWGVGDPLKEYSMSGGLFNETPVATSRAIVTIPARGQDPVGALSVSSNGAASGTGIVWAAKPLQNPDHATVPGIFYAFDALTLNELWDSSQNAARDSSGYFAKFVPPTVANGKVYLATCALPTNGPSSVSVYGLLPGVDAGP
jgi:hypothetical protein